MKHHTTPFSCFGLPLRAAKGSQSVAQAAAIARHSLVNRIRVLALVFTCSIAIVGCTTPTSVVEDTADGSQQTVEDQAGQTDDTSASSSGTSVTENTVIRRAPSVTQRGTTIEAIVNGQPVTNYDVDRRRAFLRLRRANSANALEEMVEQTIKLQEARRRNTLASNSEVDEAFAGFARSNRLSQTQLNQVLSQSGVTASHFKDFIRTQISWNRAVGAKLRSEVRQATPTEALLKVRESGGAKPQTTEYLLEQIIFVIPSTRANDNGYAAQRRRDADAFRSQFSGCGNTLRQAAGMRDVTVRKLPRTLEPQLPDEWKDELIALSEGGVTGTKKTERGIEYIAICTKRTVSDDNAAVILNQAQQFESFNEQGDELSKAFLDELKADAQIIYR